MSVPGRGRGSSRDPDEERTRAWHVHRGAGRGTTSDHRSGKGSRATTARCWPAAPYGVRCFRSRPSLETLLQTIWRLSGPRCLGINPAIFSQGRRPATGKVLRKARNPLTAAASQTSLVFYFSSRVRDGLRPRPTSRAASAVRMGMEWERRRAAKAAGSPFTFRKGQTARGPAAWAPEGERAGARRVERCWSLSGNGAHCSRREARRFEGFPGARGTAHRFPPPRPGR